MISGFRRNARRGNVRKKISTAGASDEEEGQIETAIVPPIPGPAIPATEVVPAKIKTKKTSSKTSLSFGDELEKEDEFVLKRSKASINLEEQIKREKKRKKKKEKNIDSENVKIGSPEILARAGIPVDTSAIINFDLNKYEEVKDEMIDEDYDNASHHFSFGRKISNPGDIPDAATIYAMKKKREHARQFSGQVNYIPLDTNKHEGRFASGTSRLVREELDDSSDEDRVAMKGSCSASHPALERRKQVAKALEEVEEDNEETEQNGDDFQRWEDEQIKKGSTIPANQPVTYGPKLQESNNVITNILINSNTTTYSTAVEISSTSYNQTSVLATNFPYQMYASNYLIPSTEQQEITVDLVEQRLSEQLDTKKQLYRLHQKQCDKTKFDLDSSKENIITLEKKALDVSDRFTFFQDIRGFVKDLLGCLREKIRKISKLEDSMHELLKKKSDKLIARRQNDIKDEILQINGKQSSDSDRINKLRNRRIAEREGRRARRAKRRIDTEEKHNDGMSSDDEIMTSDQLRFDADKSKITKESENMFEDVVEDFQSLQQIVSRFEQWKFGFSDSYKEAFLSLCLPKLFTPFIKLELLDWNPFDLDESDFEDFDWYISLALYGHHEGMLDEEDEDLNLLPNIIEKVLIPKLTILMRDVWDPMSCKQTKHITCLIQKLIDDYPTITKESKNSQILFDTIVTRLSNAVENEIYIPLYSREILESKNSHALTFLERQFWKGVKLLQNIMEWNWLLSQKKLLQLGIDAILNRYLIIALQQFPNQVSSLEKAKVIVNILPKEWLETSDTVIVGMQSFARCLHGLAESIYKSYLGYTDISDQRKMKITVKKIISLLMHIKAFDEARLVANEFTFRKDKDSPLPSPASVVT